MSFTALGSEVRVISPKPAKPLLSLRTAIAAVEATDSQPKPFELSQHILIAPQNPVPTQECVPLYVHLLCRIHTREKCLL